MARSVDQSDLLDWIEGVQLDPDRASRLESFFAEDPSLRHWAQEARRDRDRLRDLWEIESKMESAGLTQTAMEQSERDVLLGDAPIPIDTKRRHPPHARRPVRRIRVTPFRVVAAAGIIIISGTATLFGLILGGPATRRQPPLPGESQIAQGPTEAEFDADLSPIDIDGSIALADATPARENALFQSDSPAGLSMSRARDQIPSKPTDPKPQGSTSGFTPDDMVQTVDSLASFDEAPAAKAPPSERKAAKKALSALSFQLIHPSEHAPEHAVAPERAAELALSGRLLLLIRAEDPRAVEAALLQTSRSADDPLDPLWRSVLELAGAPADRAEAEPGSDSARVVLVDVVATAEAMERLIASATRAEVGAGGAWLQEIANPVHIEPREETADLLWWMRSFSEWGKPTAVPVLIERVDPVQSDAAAPDAGETEQPKP